MEFNVCLGSKWLKVLHSFIPQYYFPCFPRLHPRTVYGVGFSFLFSNKATQLSKEKNNTADALFICDSSHIIEHVQNGLKMSIT